ncbi:hypothetical protein BDW_04910 [Bdellovibrio bacteriovorus W]|nr:hypothetical protein BDW_04910 [Bdellovibrio bacteriovorus W]
MKWNPLAPTYGLSSVDKAGTVIITAGEFGSAVKTAFEDRRFNNPSVPSTKCDSVDVQSMNQ